MDQCHQLPPKPAIVRKSTCKAKNAPKTKDAPPVQSSSGETTDNSSNSDSKSNAKNVTNVYVYPPVPARSYSVTPRASQPTVRYRLIKENRIVVFAALGAGPLAHSVSSTTCVQQTCSAVVKPRYLPDVGAGFLYSHRSGLSGGAMATGRGSFYGLVGWGF